MKIIILQSIAGHAEPMHQLSDFSFPPGAVVEIVDPLAAAWIESGTAKLAHESHELTMPVEVYTLDPEVAAKAAAARQRERKPEPKKTSKKKAQSKAGE